MGTIGKLLQSLSRDQTIAMEAEDGDTTRMTEQPQVNVQAQTTEQEN
jgi:hypothetical protein